MKRWIVLLLALLVAAPAFGATWSDGRLRAGTCAVFTFSGSDAANAQPAIEVPAGELAFTAETSGVAVDIDFYYVVEASDNPATVGTLVATVTGTGRFPSSVPSNGGMLDVDIDTDGSGGTVRVCAASYAYRPGGAVGAVVASAETSAFDVIANGTTGVSWFAVGGFRQYTNRCQQLQEAMNPYLDTEATAPNRWKVRYTGTFAVSWSDFYDAGDTRHCLLLKPTTSDPGAGNGGYSLDNASRRGWPVLHTRDIATGMDARTATGGSGTTIEDADGASLASGVSRYVRVTAGTCSGQTRAVSGTPTATVITVDTAWTACTPDVTSIFDVFDVPRKISGAIHYTIFWDNAVLNVDQTGQSEIGIVLQRGDQWHCGQRAASNAASACGFARGYEYGDYEIRLVGTEMASTGWIDGRLAEVGTTAFVNADGAMIGEVNFGATNIQLAAHYNLYGDDGSTPSQDNIGLMHAGSWAFDRQAGGQIQRWGNAIINYWNTYGTWNHIYVSQNFVGEARGTVTAGGNMRHLSTCTSGVCGDVESDNHGLFVNNARYESNDYGQILLFDTAEAGHNDLHLENGTVAGHQIIAGAGQCSVADATTVGRPCAEDANCGTGACSATGGTVNNRFVFKGGRLGTHTPAAANPNWRQAILGRNFSQQFASLILDGGVVVPTTTIPANSTGTLPCTGPGAPYWYCTAANTNPTLTVSFALPSVAATVDGKLIYGEVEAPSTTEILIWPYNQVSGNKPFTIGPWTITTDGASNPAAGEVMPLGTPGNEIAPTVANAYLWGWPFRSGLVLDSVNTFFKDLVCTPGSYDDAGEAAESTSWRAYFSNVASDTDALNDAMAANAALAMTEGTHASGTPVSTFIGVNTALFSCEDDNDASGAAECNSVGSSGEFNVGITLVAETDATGNNVVRATCRMRGFYSPFTD
jgi:hypothetical protein